MTESIVAPVERINSHRLVIFASSLGAAIEWYDFYLYGSLAAIIAKAFFSGVNDQLAFIFALLAFSAGFAARPFGALVFGRFGDTAGRKSAFLITIIVMGSTTALVGLLPTYAEIGVAAPLALLGLRITQGLAIGGEYGGAATYVAEHAPAGKRGAYTGWIQTTAAGGQILSLVVILACQFGFGAKFAIWGWRVPFLLSVVLLAISVIIRSRLAESPVFRAMRAEGKTSPRPLREAIGDLGNLKIMVFVLFGAVAGQAVVSYTANFYSLFFLTQVLKVDTVAANLMLVTALLIATPTIFLAAWLSDRIGRKRLIMAGLVLAVFTYMPIFKAITHFANPALEAASRSQPITVVADPKTCSFQFDPIGKASFTSGCDVAKRAVARFGAPYGDAAALPGSTAFVRVGAVSIASFEGGGLKPADFAARSAAFETRLDAALKSAGYPARADPAGVNAPMVVLMLIIPLLYSSMAYGPLAAWLVELFPPRIRYTSVSLPYHLGNGWVGGFVNPVAFAVVLATGNLYAGLWYTLGFAGLAFVVGGLFLRETRGVAAV
ncbi:MAG TPA: MFS transporter [Caulobacteraceae bacterium]|jgi:MFS family permease